MKCPWPQPVAPFVLLVMRPMYSVALDVPVLRLLDTQLCLHNFIAICSPPDASLFTCRIN